MTSRHTSPEQVPERQECSRFQAGRVSKFIVELKETHDTCRTIAIYKLTAMKSSSAFVTTIGETMFAIIIPRGLAEQTKNNIDLMI